MVGSRETGNETYIAQLLGGLAETYSGQLAAAVDPKVVLPDVLRDSAIQELALVPSGNWSRLLWSLPKLCRQWQADILHVTYVAPFLLPCPFVVSVHDISFRRYPAFFSPRDRLLFATLLPLTLRRAKAVLTLSGHAKAELEDVYPWLDGRVYVTPLAPNPMYRKIADPQILERVCLRYGLCHDFVMAVGNLQPRKNLVRLIQAFAKVKEELDGCQLVIVGKAQWRASNVHSLVESLGLTKDVRFTGYVPDQDLLALYNATKAFVYPSLYEGFGLPILEAMACGTPVISSNAASLPEVAGDAAILVDPQSEDDLASAILHVVTDASLAEELVTAGSQHVGQFSWRKTATQTIEIYERATD